MKRKIYNELLKWKNEWSGKTAILVDGVRRVGKSYIVEEFAKNEYKSHILIDFSKPNKQMESLFADHLSNLDVFFQWLSLLTDVIVNHHSSFYRNKLIIYHYEVLHNA